MGAEGDGRHNGARPTNGGLRAMPMVVAHVGWWHGCDLQRSGVDYRWRSPQRHGKGGGRYVLPERRTTTAVAAIKEGEN
ncbi:hypothetical protein SESBI_25055 [Sesbania bispinosa]|nr:hypothetical protein SESBI_25055 [Sesbania bispinosa]